MKDIRLFVLGIIAMFLPNLSGYSQYTSPIDSLGGAPVPPEIENPEILGINKEAAHATLMPYANITEAIVANRHASTFCRSLNGIWKFNWVSWPQMSQTLSARMPQMR